MQQVFKLKKIIFSWKVFMCHFRVIICYAWNMCNVLMPLL